MKTVTNSADDDRRDHDDDAAERIARGADPAARTAAAPARPRDRARMPGQHVLGQVPVDRRAGRPSARLDLFDHDQHAAGLDRRAFGDRDVLDPAGLRRAQFVLHLHSFDDDDRLAGGDFVTRRHENATTRPGIGATIACAPSAWAAASPRPRRARRPSTRGGRGTGRRARPGSRPCRVRRTTSASRLDAGVTVDQQRQARSRRPARASTTCTASVDGDAEPARAGRLDRDAPAARRRARSRRSSAQRGFPRPASSHGLGAPPADAPAPPDRRGARK